MSVGLNAPRIVLGKRSGFSIWARKVRIRSIVHCGAAGVSKSHKAACQNDDRKQTAKELYSLDSLQAPFVTENALLRFQGSPWGFRGVVSVSKTVPFVTDSISCYHYDPRHVLHPFVYYPCYWHWARSCPFSTHKKSTSPPTLHKTLTWVVEKI